MAHSLLERFRSTNGLKVVIYFCKINTYSISAPTLFFSFFLWRGGGGGAGGGRREGGRGFLLVALPLLQELLSHLNLGV